MFAIKAYVGMPEVRKPGSYVPVRHYMAAGAFGNEILWPGGNSFPGGLVRLHSPENGRKKESRAYRPGSLMLDFDFNPVAAFPFRFGHVDGQDAVPVSCPGFFRLDPGGEGQGAGERAVVPLAVDVVLRPRGFAPLELATYGDAGFIDRNVHVVVAVQTRQFALGHY